MSQDLNFVETVTLAKQIALSGSRSHEIHSGRWLWCFDSPRLHVEVAS
jgi:hypothetical protein